MKCQDCGDEYLDPAPAGWECRACGWTGRLWPVRELEPPPRRRRRRDRPARVSLLQLYQQSQEPTKWDGLCSVRVKMGSDW